MSIVSCRNRLRSKFLKASTHTHVVRLPIVAYLMGALLLLGGCTAVVPESATPPPPLAAHAIEPTASTSVPKCVLSASSVDFGEIYACDKNERTVRVSNQGGAPLTLSAVGSSCGCTEAELDLPEVIPGEEAILTVRLALSEYPKDEVNTRVTLETNDPLNKTQEIDVDAKILPEFTVKPAEIDFGKVKRGVRTTQVLTIKQTGKQPITLSSVEVPPALSVSIREDSLAAPLRQFTVELAFLPDETMSTLETQAILITDVARMPRFPVRLRAQVVGIECTFNPGVLVFGPSAPGSQTLPVELTSPNPVEILSVESPDKSLQAVATPLEAPKRHNIYIRIAPDARPGNRSGKLLARVQEGALTETIAIPFFGTVSQ